MEKTNVKKPAFGFSILILMLCATVLVAGTIFFKAKLQVMFLLCWLIVIPAAIHLGYSYSEVETAALDFTRKVMQPIMIMLAVGAMIGMWIACGAVPTMIYFGMKLISPSLFLVTTLILCSLASLATGTSVGTVGTVGIALIGVGMGLGIPNSITAAAILCGAMFGDKMSPLSDTTILCPAIAGCEVMEHVKHMLYTTLPAYIISMGVFFVTGLKYGGSALDTSRIEEILVGIRASFNLGFIQIIPVLLVLALLLMRKPSFFSIMMGAVAGFVVTLITQGASVQECFNYMWGGYTLESEVALVKTLFTRGGIYSMAATALTMIFAFGFAGVLVKSGMMDAILEPLVKRCHSVGSVVSVTAILCYGINLLGSLSLAQVMAGTLMAPMFKEKGLKAKNLSRCLEDFGTFGTALVPWSNLSIIVQGTLGVAATAYIPWCVLLYVTPIFDLIFAFTGFSMDKLEPEEETEAVVKA